LLLSADGDYLFEMTAAKGREGNGLLMKKEKRNSWNARRRGKGEERRIVCSSGGKRKGL